MTSRRLYGTMTGFGGSKSDLVNVVERPGRSLRSLDAWVDPDAIVVLDTDDQICADVDRAEVIDKDSDPQEVVVFSCLIPTSGCGFNRSKPSHDWGTMPQPRDYLLLVLAITSA